MKKLTMQTDDGSPLRYCEEMTCITFAHAFADETGAEEVKATFHHGLKDDRVELQSEHMWKMLTFPKEVG